MLSSNHKDYYDHLLKTSVLGDIYRKYLLFPYLSKNLKGQCLDIGCGLGKFIEFRKNTHGSDINKVVINNLRKKGLEIFLIENDILPVKDKSYDSLLMDNVLEHIHNPQKLLFECKRVLKDNGIFLIGVPGKKGFDSEDDHKVFYNRENLEFLMLKFDFQLIKVDYKPIKFNFLDSILRQYCMYCLFKKK